MLDGLQDGMDTVTYKSALTSGVRSGPGSSFTAPTARGPVRAAPADAVLAYPPLSYRLSMDGGINPFQKSEGETLPPGLGRNYHGLLMRHITLAPELDQATLKKEAAYLKDHTIIASFLGKKITPHACSDWICSINRKLGYDAIAYKMDMGRGFIFLSSPDRQTTNKVLALTPHVTPWGTCVYQEWEPGFNPDYPEWLRIPTWIQLVKLPHEFKPVEGYIASCLGPVYLADSENANNRDPRFCVGIDAAKGWPSTVRVVGIDGRVNTILVNYEHVPVRCRFCLSLNHRVADCVALKLNGTDGFWDPDQHRSFPQSTQKDSHPKAPAAAPHPQPKRTFQERPRAQIPAENQVRREKQVDQDGFTKVQSKKSRSSGNQTTSTDSRRASELRNRPTPPSSREHDFRPPSPPRMSQWIQQALPRSDSSQQLLTSEQVQEMLATPGDSEAEKEAPMNWSPGRYGRYPSSKRPAQPQGSSRKKILESPSSSDTSRELGSQIIPQSPRLASAPALTPKKIQAPDSPTRIHIIYDKSPQEAFRLLEKAGCISSSSDSKPEEKSPPTQALSNSVSSLDSSFPVRCSAPQRPSSPSESSSAGVSSSLPTPEPVTRLAETQPSASELSQQGPAILVSLKEQDQTLNKEANKIRSLTTAAAFKAKWIEMNRKLDNS
ncbi:hypothetical protein KC19_5G032900 [Ceratodon purpureus]|uniref:DUF4283 domain-containing protein n=1 Tax=Ceratodon purpureus TaxID=3225 RepID=A0A8T0HYH7_CERPU|nr:hypothetical protein KC19_5G032900 [Ceratodon purpureus]